jgi:hypothetical protein
MVRVCLWCTASNARALHWIACSDSGLAPKPATESLAGTAAACHSPASRRPGATTVYTHLSGPFSQRTITDGHVLRATPPKWTFTYVTCQANGVPSMWATMAITRWPTIQNCYQRPPWRQPDIASATCPDRSGLATPELARPAGAGALSSSCSGRAQEQPVTSRLKRLSAKNGRQWQRRQPQHQRQLWETAGAVSWSR